MSEFTIRESVPFDLAAILKIERANANAAHWGEGVYRQLWDDPEKSRIAFVAEQHAEVLAFLVARQIAGEWELENVAVAPGAQQKGIGTALLRRLMEVLAAARASKLFLEVRESNSVAQRLYENVGLELAGRRKNYYSSPLEDALLYQKSFADLSVKIR